MNKVLSISVVNWNTREHLGRCLDSLREACRGIDAEVIVVDNASSDGSAELVRDRYPEVRLLPLQQNEGFAEANNIAIRESTGDFLLLLNPDIYAPVGSLDALLGFLAAHPEVAGVGAALVGADGRVQTPFYRRFPSRTQVLLFYTALSYLAWWIPALKSRYFDFRVRGVDPVEVDQLPGACCLLRREVVDEVGLMDPDYFIWFEDVDWCYRIRKAGHRLLVLPTVQMLHAGGASFHGWSSDRRVWQFFLAMFRFFSKHSEQQLLQWSFRVVSKDLLLKEWVLRHLPLPTSVRARLPHPDTLKALRPALREVLRLHGAGQLVRLTDSVPSIRSDSAPAGV